MPLGNGRAGPFAGSFAFVLPFPVAFFPFAGEGKNHLQQKGTKHMKKEKKTEEQKPTRKYANEVRLVGYLGDQPSEYESRAVISVATKTSWKPAGSDQWQDRTEWHQVVAWGKLAETVATLTLQKGDHVEVTGELRSRAFEPVPGTVVTAWEVRARSVSVLDRAADRPKAA